MCGDDAFLTSILVALRATLIALVLGSLAALAVARHRFFGRELVSFVLIFPLALPGIVTGMALSTTFATTSLPLGILAIIIGHATFCIVMVYNNVLARLRRTAGSQEEASADLGADSWQTFRFITFPAIRSAMLAGALLAFALSFDEVIVTIFVAGGVKTLRIWIFQSFRLANQVALVNVAGMVATRLTRDTGAVGRTRRSGHPALTGLAGKREGHEDEDRHRDPDGRDEAIEHPCTPPATCAGRAGRSTPSRSARSRSAAISLTRPA